MYYLQVRECGATNGLGEAGLFTSPRSYRQKQRILLHRTDWWFCRVRLVRNMKCYRARRGVVVNSAMDGKPTHALFGSPPLTSYMRSGSNPLPKGLPAPRSLLEDTSNRTESPLPVPEPSLDGKILVVCMRSDVLNVMIQIWLQQSG